MVTGPTPYLRFLWLNALLYWMENRSRSESDGWNETSAKARSQQWRRHFRWKSTETGNEDWARGVRWLNPRFESLSKRRNAKHMRGYDRQATSNSRAWSTGWLFKNPPVSPQTQLDDGRGLYRLGDQRDKYKEDVTDFNIAWCVGCS